MLFTWTDKYPELSKIREAYTMLISQGISHQPQKNVIMNSSKKTTNDSTLKLMETDKFKRLLQSKNQKDIVAANLMIQNMVRDNDRKMQIQNRRLNDLQSAYENSILLKEMLDEHDFDQINDDTVIILREIYENCVKLKPTVSRLAEESQESEAFMNKILETSDAINAAIELYNAIVINNTATPVVRANTESSSADLLKVVLNESKTETDDLTVLNDIFSTPPSLAPSTSNSILLTPQVVSLTKPDVLDNLGADYFQQQKISLDDDLFKDVDTFPINHVNKIDSLISQTPKSKATLSELDSIVSGIKTKLLSDATHVSESISPQESCEVDEHILSANDSQMEEKQVSNDLTPVNECDRKVALKDINLNINEIQPSDIEEPRTILDEANGLKVLLNFTKDRPAKDVVVLVVTVINQGALSINNFQFDASVTKPCKLRLMEASGTELPGVKKFKPPTDTIDQVLLLLNPTQMAVNMVAILTYNIQDDPDPYKESIEVKNIPFAS
jgi:ADP-ribosylation factor-binding protein GGA